MRDPNLMYFGFTEEQRRAIQAIVSSDEKTSVCITNGPTNTNEKLFNINECRTGNYLFKSERPNLPFERLYNLNRYKIIKIAARQQVEQGALSFDSLDCFINRLKVSVNGLMTAENPSLVYSSTWPQCAFDYLVLLWCQSNQIKFIFEEIIPYFNRAVLMESRCISPSWESVSAFSGSKLLTKQVDIEREIINGEIKNRIEELRAGFGVKFNSYVPGMVEQYSQMVNVRIFPRVIVWISAYLKNLISISLGRSRSIGYTSFRIEKTKGKLELRSMRMGTLLYKSFRSYFWSQKLRKVYRQYATSMEEIRKISEKSVIISYFAVQEPESSILCGSGSIQSNLTAIELLLSVLPDNHVIVYKEHLSGLFFHDYVSKGAEPENKIIDGLIDLIKEKKLLLAPLECDKFDLLDCSSGVSTTIGNIGFEATLMDLPVLTLGRPWYFTNNLHFDFENANLFFSSVKTPRKKIDLTLFFDHLEELLSLSVKRTPPESFSFLSRTRIDRSSRDYYKMMTALYSLATRDILC